MNDLVGRLLEIDLQQVLVFLDDALRNPADNQKAFILIVSAITILFAIIVMSVVMTFLAVSDDEDEDEGASDGDWAEEAAVAPVGAADEPLQSRIPRAAWNVIWFTLFAVVWLLTGTVTKDDAVCVSCHNNTELHAARTQAGMRSIADPHRKVADCVECHETSNAVAAVTTAVPWRVVHVALGVAVPGWAGEYGAPVPNRACAGCHASAITSTSTDERRGIRMSHSEPLEAGALCTDCHKPSDVGGVISGFTVGMDPCMRCHDSIAVSAECSYCHVKDIGAAVQTTGEFKARSHASEMDCSGCHTDQSRCDSCHGIRMPHSTVFLGAGHAREGVKDIWFNGGRGCRRCHTENRRPCERCHGATFPGHPPSYMITAHAKADPYNNGCDGCHGAKAWVNGRNFCGNCHERYATPLQRGTSSLEPSKK